MPALDWAALSAWGWVIPRPEPALDWATMLARGWVALQAARSVERQLRELGVVSSVMASLEHVASWSKEVSLAQKL